jgi:hypothetical protein
MVTVGDIATTATRTIATESRNGERPTVLSVTSDMRTFGESVICGRSRYGYPLLPWLSWSYSGFRL